MKGQYLKITYIFICHHLVRILILKGYFITALNKKIPRNIFFFKCAQSQGTKYKIFLEN